MKAASYWAKNSFNIALFLGAIISISYFISIGYYPSNLSIGDVLFFIVTLFAFSSLYILFIAVLFAGGIVFTPVLSSAQSLFIFTYKKVFPRKEAIFKVNFKSITWDYLGFVVGGGIFILFSISLLFTDKYQLGINFLICMVAMSLIYGLWNTRPKKNKKRRLARPFLILGVLLIPIIVSGFYVSLLESSMQLLGMRVESVAMQFSEKHKGLFKYAGISLNKDKVHEDVTILFKGIGDKVFIEIEGFKTEVSNQDVHYFIKPLPKKAEETKKE